MNIKQLEIELDKLGTKHVDLNLLISEAEVLKTRYVEQQDESNANILWVCLSILQVHKLYNQAFLTLKRKEYNEGWRLLEKAEIEILFLKKHLRLVKKTYKINFIESAITRLQALFPYSLFASSELLEKEIKCGICDEKISIRNPCRHRTGELYMGEMCFYIVTDCEFLGTAIVENPVNKYSVLFNESDDQHIRDNIQFGNLNYILNLLKNPYENWNLEVYERIFPHSQFKNIKPDDLCPCGEGEKYIECCLLEDGVQGFHYQFNLSKQILKRIKQ